MTLDQIEDHARTFARARAELAERCEALEDELRRARRSKIRGIKSAAARAHDAQDRLRAAIAEAPHLFTKPKTLTIEGIRVGYIKGKGKVEWDNPATVCQLIRRHLPEQAETLIITTERPARPALAQLTASELRRLGCRLEDTGDTILIKPQDSAIDKLVDAILAEKPEDTADDEA